MAKTPVTTKPPAPAPETVGSPFDDERASGAAFTPAESGRKAFSEPPTMVEAIPPFQLMAHPNKWTVSNGVVLPALRKLKYIPGCGGVDVTVDRHGKAHTRPGVARNEWQERGWTPIAFDAVPAAHGVSSYLWKPQGRPDVTLHYCERVYSGATQIDCNEKKYAEWCAYLEESGVIKPPPVFVLRELLLREEAALSAAVDKQRTNSAYAATVDVHKANIAGIKAKIAERQSELVPVAATSEDAYHPAEG